MLANPKGGKLSLENIFGDEKSKDKYDNNNSTTYYIVICMCVLMVRKSFFSTLLGRTTFLKIDKLSFPILTTPEDET